MGWGLRLRRGYGRNYNIEMVLFEVHGENFIQDFTSISPHK